MFRHPFLALLLLSAHAAEATDSSAVPPATGAVVLEPLIVRDHLDRAREDIVPSLGAAEFQLDRSQIDALAPGSNAGFNDVLLRVPGVAQDSFGQVHIRGEHADLQYRINDVLLPEGLSGFGQELDTRFVNTVSVLTGALPAQYGYRTAGVVDIHTRNVSHTGGEMTVYAGSFGTERASLETTAAGARSNAYVTASAERSDLGVENPTAARSAVHDHKSQEKVFAYASAVIDESSRVNLMVSGSFARFQIPNNPGQAPLFAVQGATDLASADLDEHQREENHYAILAYQKSAGDFSGQISAFSRYSLIAFTPDRLGDVAFNGVASRVRRSLVGNGVEADAKAPLGPAHTLRGGLLITSTNAGTHTTASVLPLNPQGDPTSDVPFDLREGHRKLGWLGGVYAQDEWTPSTRLTVNYGLRADESRGYRSEGQISPRISVVYAMPRDTTLHAGYARYFTPAPIELTQIPNLSGFAGTSNAAANTQASTVRAERADYFDLGVTTQLRSDLSFSADVYAKDTTNQLDEGQFGQALIFSAFNYRHGRTRGAEVSGNYAHGGFSAYANIAVSQTSVTQIVSGEFQFDAEELAYIAHHDVHPDHDQRLTGSAGISYRQGHYLAYVDLLYGSGLRRGFANTGHLPAYHPLGLGLEGTFQLRHHLELRARIDVTNLLDERYELRDGSGIGVGAPQFGQRRGLFGGLTLAF